MGPGAQLEAKGHETFLEGAARLATTMRRTHSMFGGTLDAALTRQIIDMDVTMDQGHLMVTAVDTLSRSLVVTTPLQCEKKRK